MEEFLIKKLIIKFKNKIKNLNQINKNKIILEAHNKLYLNWLDNNKAFKKKFNNRIKGFHLGNYKNNKSK
jgi:hypothetical protein